MKINNNQNNKKMKMKSKNTIKTNKNGWHLVKLMI